MSRARTILLQLRDVFLALPPARRASFAALAALAVGGTLALVWWVQRPSWGVLFANLEASDAGAVVDYLKSEKVPYRIAEGGAAIEVPQGQVYELRVVLAGRGLPTGGGGVGFEIFDKQTLGMTDFVQRLDYQRALQGELARTIAGLSSVEAARVHLALPERSLFVSEERRPSASVVVKLRPGRQLGPDQVAGIVHLVAASVEGLKPSEVTIVDTGGTILSSGHEEPGASGSAEGMHSYQREIEEGYAERIESMLERVLGPGHAVARVTASLDLAQVERTEEVFDPDRTVLKSERRNVEKSLAPGPSGVPGVSATLTNEPAPAAASESAQSEREDSMRSYEVTRLTSRRVEPMGGIRKLTVAVLIDGVAQGGGDARTFVPRPAEEIERYKELVKRVVGFNAERGDEIEIVSTPFRSPEVEPLAAPGLLARLAGWSDALWRLAGLAVALVVALAVVRPTLLAMLRRVPASPAAAVAPAELTGPRADTPQLTSASQLIEAARRNPEQTALVIRQWVSGEAET